MSEEKPKKKNSHKKKPGPKKKTGRKPYYEIMHMKDKLDSVRGWCMQGSTDAEIMEMLGISADTFYKWKREKAEFADALKRGKDIANGELLNSAFKQSTGYYVPVTTVVKVRKPIMVEGDPVIVGGQPVIVDGQVLRKAAKVYYDEEVVTVPNEEYVAPNPTMNIFMLKNRLPDEYKDKKELTVTDTRLEDFMGDDEDGDELNEL